MLLPLFAGVVLSFAVTQASRTQDCIAFLNRIDNSKGYIPGNIQWVHKEINMMRDVLCEFVFANWCQLVVNLQLASDSKNFLVS